VKGDHMLKRREALPAGSGPAIAKCDERFGLKTSGEENDDIEEQQTKTPQSGLVG
jgi:hypothetical protein